MDTLWENVTFNISIVLGIISQHMDTIGYLGSFTMVAMPVPGMVLGMSWAGCGSPHGY